MKSLIISAWSILDPFYFFCTRLRYINQEDGKKCIFRVRLTHYRGHQVKLSDGTVIHKNDVLLKIHFHNVRLLKEFQGINNEYKKAIILYKRVQESLPYLACYVKSHNHSYEIKGLIGITMINRATEKLGFESEPIFSYSYKWMKQLIQYPIHLLSLQTVNGNEKIKSEPVYLFMSKDTLLNKYDFQNKKHALP